MPHFVTASAKRARTETKGEGEEMAGP